MYIYIRFCNANFVLIIKKYLFMTVINNILICLKTIEIVLCTRIILINFSFQDETFYVIRVQ